MVSVGSNWYSLLQHSERAFQMKASLTPQEGKNAFSVTSEKVTCGVCLCGLLFGWGGILLCGFFYPNPIHNKHWHLLPKEREQSMAKCHPTYILIWNSYFWKRDETVLLYMSLCSNPQNYIFPSFLVWRLYPSHDFPSLQLILEIPSLFISLQESHCKALEPAGHLWIRSL